MKYFLLRRHKVFKSRVPLGFAAVENFPIIFLKDTTRAPCPRLKLESHILDKPV